MNRKKMIGYCVMALIPTVFFLILLAIYSFPLMLLAVLLLILGLGILKRKRPELFDALRKNNDDGLPVDAPPHTPISHRPSSRTYLVLSGMNVSNQHSITMDHSPFIIGRDEDCNYTMKDPTVSRRHMILEYDDENEICHVKDVSTNGTYLNSQRLTHNQKTELKQGDILQIGSTAFSVEYAHYYITDQYQHR